MINKQKNAMPTSADKLAQRRLELIAQSTRQRAELSQQGQVLLHHLASIDLGLSLIGRIRQQPWLMAGIAAGLVLLKPQRMIAKVQTGMAMWHSVRKVMPIVLPIFQALLAKMRNRN